jgi:hypothetical protein
VCINENSRPKVSNDGLGGCKTPCGVVFELFAVVANYIFGRTTKKGKENLAGARMR